MFEGLNTLRQTIGPFSPVQFAPRAWRKLVGEYSPPSLRHSTIPPALNQNPDSVGLGKRRAPAIRLTTQRLDQDATGKVRYTTKDFEIRKGRLVKEGNLFMFPIDHVSLTSVANQNIS